MIPCICDPTHDLVYMVLCIYGPIYPGPMYVTVWCTWSCVLRVLSTYEWSFVIMVLCMVLFAYGSTYMVLSIYGPMYNGSMCLWSHVYMVLRSFVSMYGPMNLRFYVLPVVRMFLRTYVKYENPKISATPETEWLPTPRPFHTPRLVRLNEDRLRH